MDQAKLKRSDYILFLIAIFMLVVYIFFYPQIFPHSALKLKLTETQISQQANQILEDLGYNTADFTHRLTLRQNIEQIRYLQKQFGLKRANEIIKENLIPVYFWKIDLKDKSSSKNVIRFSYDSEEEATQAVEKALSDTISLNLNVAGELIQLQVQLGEKDQIDTLSYEEALTLANSLLKKTQPERFHLFKLTPTKNERQLSRIEYNFAWENSQHVYSEKETIKISVYGNFVNKYQAIFTPPKDVVISSSKSEFREIPVVIAWITIIILFIVLLIKKLKKDEIELRSNVILSVLVTLAWMFILVNNIQFSEEKPLFAIIISVIVTSPFVFIGFLIVSSISESSARDVWEEKLLTFDALRKRTMLFPQFSLSIFRGLALAFIATGLLTLLLKIASLINNYYMDFEDSNLTVKFSLLPVVYVIAVALMRTGFYEFIFRLFFVSTFRRRVNKSITIIIITALIAIFSHGVYADLRISPYFLNLAINLFIAALFIAFFIKWDFITVWLGALAYYLLRELYPMTFFDSGFFMWNGISMWIIFGIIILLGIIGYHRKVDIRAIQRYIPSYIIRREERERIQREFEIARRVQFSFLPREKPKLKGIDLASICIPAMEVGGDYYDFIELDDNRLGVVIGDVSGKGISAAFHMTLTKGFLKSQAKSGLSPREIMINLNELFYENVERGTFISMIYGIFDLNSRTFTFARAGHNPLLIQKGMDEKVEILCPKGLALGLEKGILFERVIEEYTIGIQSNDIFVFYTDGFSEAMNNKKEEFGEDRLQKLLQKNSLPSAEHIINHIKTEIINFVGDAPQHDDMTMLVVKIL
ncbi:MAG: PP2C family protein-serine/threonine phosphatase [bacterium]|nr:MAG: PP2C family protein-serine/threonine phosphatase [bacterium]